MWRLVNNAFIYLEIDLEKKTFCYVKDRLVYVVLY